MKNEDNICDVSEDSTAKKAGYGLFAIGYALIYILLGIAAFGAIILLFLFL